MSCNDLKRVKFVFRLFVYRVIEKNGTDFISVGLNTCGLKGINSHY